MEFLEYTRGEIWWATLPEPSGSMPGFRRPVVIISSNGFNRSNIKTILAVILTSNLSLASSRGNVLLPAKKTGLPKDSVANVTQIITIDKAILTDRVGYLSSDLMQKLDQGLRLAMAL
jgi:mRNA interferase MazF